MRKFNGYRPGEMDRRAMIDGNVRYGGIIDFSDGNHSRSLIGKRFQVNSGCEITFISGHMNDKNWGILVRKICSFLTRAGTYKPVFKSGAKNQ